MTRIVSASLLALLCAAGLRGGPICPNCIEHKQPASVAAGSAANDPSFHPNDDDLSFFNPAPLSPHPGSGQMLVFLPGHGVKTSAYTNFVEVAANRGYHALVLSYYNLVGSVASCGPHPDCYEPLRKQLFDGTITAAQWDVNTITHASNGGDPKHFSAEDAVRHRLINFLFWLAHHGQGSENWGQFLANPNCARESCEVQWSKVVLAGHSLGSGEAAFIATERDVARIIMISGVTDKNAAWTQASRIHPEKYFALANVCDQTFYDSTVKNWANFHMPGPRTYIEKGLTPTPPDAHMQTCPNLPAGEGSTAPFGNSHQLVSGYNNGCASGSGHGQVAVNCTGAEPDSLRDAWKYLLGVPPQ